VRIGEDDVSQLADEPLSTVRNQRVGFVFQFHHLLREFSAIENVMMPLRISGLGKAEATDRAANLLARVGLAHRASHRPAELSGGEQQRTAVARALAMSPSVILADEPSGNLDHHNADALHDLLAGLSAEDGLGLVVVTHNRSLAARAGRVLLLADGRLADTSGVEGAV
jgi:lipoprotein-releasing system ATP-binding protein